MPLIRPLVPADVPNAMRLKEAAGWNQTADDWLRLLELEGGGCFALEEDGELAATTTVITYGRDLAWIGMVLTLPSFRRRGFARILMERAIAYAESCNVSTIGLDATEMGAPLYRQLGFEPAGTIERWRLANAQVLPPIELPAWEYDARLDRAAFGANRSILLQDLATIDAASIPSAGYAMGRPGSRAFYFGPCVADSISTADALVRWFVARRPSPGEPVFWDIPIANDDAVSLARRYGFEPARRLTRMYRGAGAIGDHRMTFAIAGLEYG